jgi:serine/threonine protein phosphatase PrpC
MGIYLSAPDLRKHSENGEGNGFRYGVSAMQGWRINMEDAHITNPNFDVATGLFAVFDGHGGSEVAEFCGNHFGEELLANENYKSGDYELALKETFLLMDVMLLSPEGLAEIEKMIAEKPKPTNPAHVQSTPNKDDKPEEETFAGCTANVVLIRDGKIYVANAGDSRCVLMTKNRRVIPLSVDHKPEDPIELERITAAGGYIEDGRVNSTLNLSRAIGDLEFKKNEELSPTEQLISAEPDVLVRETEDLDHFLVIGCDGIWEIQTMDEICELIENRCRVNPDAEISEAIEEMLDRGLAPDTTLSVGCDNMSAMVVFLRE